MINTERKTYLTNFDIRSMSITQIQTFPIKTDFAFLKLVASFSNSGASFLQWPHLQQYSYKISNTIQS